VRIALTSDGSLLWQEDLKHPPRVLGSEAGFATNRVEVD
jgi:hypothetical protein